MSDKEVKLDQYDDWLKPNSDIAALVMRQWLKPVEEVAFGDEDNAVIFPPTYPIDNSGPRVATRRDGDYRVTVELPPYKEQQDKKKEGRGTAGYNIDRFEDGSSVCQIDSVGSQANHMEPIFKRREYKSLVREVIVQTTNGPINLLDAGHRAADAVVRFTFGPGSTTDDQESGDNQTQSQGSEDKSLGQQLWEAYEAWHRRGDAEPLARIAPTSIVFGSWDSRATQAKPQRRLKEWRQNSVWPMSQPSGPMVASRYMAVSDAMQ